MRDLDVQREMLKSHPGLPKKAAKELRGELKLDRERKAAKLRRVVLKQLPKVVAAIEGMVQSVGTANGLTLPDISLLPLIERWKLAQEEPLDPAAMDDEQLHEVREVGQGGAVHGGECGWLGEGQARGGEVSRAAGSRWALA